MEIKFGQKPKGEPVAQAQPQGRVTISTNPVKQKVFIDIDGNEINPRTKQIIRLEKDVH